MEWKKRREIKNVSKVLALSSWLTSCVLTELGNRGKGIRSLLRTCSLRTLKCKCHEGRDLRLGEAVRVRGGNLRWLCCHHGESGQEGEAGSELAQCYQVVTVCDALS